MNIDLESLRNTLELALSKDARFPSRFYEILFERNPELESLFTRNSRRAQVHNFGKKLVAIVDHLDDPAWTDRELGPLASSHVDYGVTPAMYPLVREALIDTLREACGEIFDEDVERNWRAAYARIESAMLART
jgi:hemoglobin-like flavoprotein